MKKWLVIIGVIILAFIGAVYIFIPDIIIVQQSVVVRNNLKGLQRSLSDNKNWSKWWPGKIEADEKKLLLNGNTYKVSNLTPSSVSVDINISSTPAKSSLLFLPLIADSIKLEWDIKVPMSYNPLKRLKLYFAASNLKNDIHSLLTSIKSYYTSTEKTYGLDIRRESVKDSSLVFISDSSKGYPSTEKIYSLIQELRKYIDSHSAIATDSPMLNIYTKDKINYITKVALPSNKILPSSGKIHYRWMLPHGNILVAEIKGDITKTDQAFSVIENYVRDYELVAPAIPFYSLVTNRLKEKDSSQWVTRIYYPIMYFKE